jgi:hypothetical protein
MINALIVHVDSSFRHWGGNSPGTFESPTVNEPADEVKPGGDERRHQDHEARDFAYAEPSQTADDDGTITNAGNADSINDFASHPGSTQMDTGVQSTHFSALSLQGSMAGGYLFSGSESKRMDDHQKYRLVVL